MSVRIALYDRKRNVIAHTVVDDEDAERTRAHRWFLLQTGYVMASLRDADRNRSGLMLHRFVLGLESLRVDGREVDHINGDRLDNRRENLRIVTRAQNAQNRRSNRNTSSRFRGVWRENRTGRWRAVVYLNRRRNDLGSYEDELEAARAAARFRAAHMTHSVEDPELLTEAA